MNIRFLSEIHSPSDVKKLDEEQLPLLAEEVRTVLIDTVSKNGGHLASNLGVVELTIALHRVFDSPKDKIVWDVGHQVYTHKLLTGRYTDFHTLRTEGGISGFSRPEESEHDMFISGHSSTSISAALGIATANAIRNDKHTSIAVIGDGALTGGLAYEALNNAGRSGSRLIVILNDNEMSISKNVGSMARYLAVIRSKPRYFKFKERTNTVISRIPFIGKPLAEFVYDLKKSIKNAIYKSTFFEDLGFTYMGPIDGHNLPLLCEALEGARSLCRPVLLHINTVKGKGYDFAEKAPSEFHGISKFNINTGEPLYSGKNFSAEFGRVLCDTAANDKRLCAITAAMSLGTGLEEFSRQFPERFFDVGIAEEHAVTFSSGLAKGGMMPVFAVYSSFLQRCYDQIIHDAALQKQHMIFAIDRAGFVGEDGETHQGIFDVPLLNSVPNITVYSPSTFEGLSRALVNAFYHTDGVVAVRYPRGAEKPLPEDCNLQYGTFDFYGEPTAENIIVTYGRLFSGACKAKQTLETHGKSIAVLKLNQIKPLDIEAVRCVLGAKKIHFFEECIKTGGVGEVFAAALAELGFKGEYKITAVEDEFVEHASVASLLSKYRLDATAMTEAFSE